jgi:hypothetical protein
MSSRGLRTQSSSKRENYSRACRRVLARVLCSRQKARADAAKTLGAHIKICTYDRAGGQVSTKEGGGVMVLVARFWQISDQNQRATTFSPRLKVGSILLLFAKKAAYKLLDLEIGWEI